jgi:hypothetical protein
MTETAGADPVALRRHAMMASRSLDALSARGIRTVVRDSYGTDLLVVADLGMAPDGRVEALLMDRIGRLLVGAYATGTWQAGSTVAWDHRIDGHPDAELVAALLGCLIDITDAAALSSAA